MMALSSIKFHITAYIIFLAIAGVLDLGLGFDTGIPEPPTLSFSATFGEEFNQLQSNLQDIPVIGFFLAGALALATVIISLIVFFLNIIFYLFNVLFLWTIPGSFVINTLLIIFRIIVMLELLPYIKNMIHPTQGGTH